MIDNAVLDLENALAGGEHFLPGLSKGSSSKVWEEIL